MPTTSSGFSRVPSGVRQCVPTSQALTVANLPPLPPAELEVSSLGLSGYLLLYQESRVPTISPAVWSAVAASFAALSAFLTMLIHRRNRLDAARPELVLTGWSRSTCGSGDTEHEVITVQTLRNVGKGPAINIVLGCAHRQANRPTAGMTTTYLPILAPAEVYDLNVEIVIWWKNIPPEKNGLQHLLLSVSLASTDYLNLRHQTEYTLVAVPLSPAQGVANPIAPGLMIHTRTTKTTPVWRLRFRSKCHRVLGRMKDLFKRASRVM
jgi:hypothetical protein